MFAACAGPKGSVVESRVQSRICRTVVGAHGPSPSLTLPHAARGGGDVVLASQTTTGTPSPGCAGGRLGWGQSPAAASVERCPHPDPPPRCARGRGCSSRPQPTTGTPSPGCAGGRLGWGQSPVAASVERCPHPIPPPRCARGRGCSSRTPTHHRHSFPRLCRRNRRCNRAYAARSQGRTLLPPPCPSPTLRAGEGMRGWDEMHTSPRTTGTPSPGFAGGRLGWGPNQSDVRAKTRIARLRELPETAFDRTGVRATIVRSATPTASARSVPRRPCRPPCVPATPSHVAWTKRPG